MSNSVNAKPILYVFTRGPYSTSRGQEGLDALLMGAAFEQEVSVLFMHDGVFQLKKGQQTDGSDLKQYTKTFRALDDFDVQQPYVLASCLAARGLTADQLTVPVTVLSSHKAAQLIQSQFRVFTF